MLRLRPSPNVRVAPLVAAPQAPCYLDQNPAEIFLDFEHPTFTGLEKVQRNEHLFLKIFCDKRNAPLPQSHFMPTFLRQVRLRLGNVKTRFDIAESCTDFAQEK